MSGLVTSSALQSRKWQLIGMSQWCRSALCGHPLPALTDNWTHGAASRHTIAQISHTRPGHSRLATCSRLLAVDRVWVEPATSWLRVNTLPTGPLHPLDTCRIRQSIALIDYHPRNDKPYREVGCFQWCLFVGGLSVCQRDSSWTVWDIIRKFLREQ